jgi:undecaprenyl-diphosphatase
VLSDHRRTFWYSLALLVATGLMFVGVGRHAPGAAPQTTFAPIGHFDWTVYRAMDDIRSAPITWLAHALNVIGGGVVTIPLRIVVSVWLVLRRRWWELTAWALTWVIAETGLRAAKDFFHRGRPPNPLVTTAGYSFPSGHALAAAATAVALVIVLLSPGSRRRRWELAAMLFAFVMGFSRVYLNAHWLSDVVAGILLGTTVALGSAVIVSELRQAWPRRYAPSPERPPGAGPDPPPHDASSDWNAR